MDIRRWTHGAGRVALGLVVAAMAMVGPVQPTHAAAPLMVIWPGYTTQFVDNFNPCSPNAFAQTNGSYAEIFEPLIIIDNVQFKVHPRLASSYAWSKDLKSITFTLRHGLKWSDGQSLTVQDVYYSAWTLPNSKNHGLCAPNPSIAGATIVDPDKITFRLKTADVTQLFTNLQLAVYPQHIFRTIKDFTTWVWTKPVGSGPFTEVKDFTPQAYEIDANPHYWEAGQPTIKRLRLVVYTSNDAGQLALEAGQVDWAHVVIPHADKVYAARNPHYHYFYYPGYTDDFLFVNTTRYPLSLVAFRKALSLAMNRRAYSINAHYGYALPADIQGVADISGKQGPWPGWVDPSIPQTLAQYNPTAARQLLKSAGFTWDTGGHLIDPQGKPVKLELLNGFYLPQATIEQQNFQALGIDVTLSNVQFAVFYGRITKGNFDLFDGWNNGGSSPYFLYYTTVSSQSYAPIGKDLSLISGNYYNWGRWKNPAMDAILQQFKVTVDPAKQHALVDKMQQLFVQYLPYIPTCTEIVDSNYNDAHFTGFPTLQDNYAYTMPYGIPGDTILMLTHIHPT